MSTDLIAQTALAKIERLTEDLRAAYEALVGGETVAAPAELRAIIGEWATDVLPAIDARIAHCHALVRRGLCAEAVGLALEEPNLFEAVKLLDLDRFGRANHAAWLDAGQAAGLAGPAPPQLDKMADIEAARGRLDELRPLLERWRRLNFQRAPLRSRIELLRKIAEQDADDQSMVWHTMLRDHEAYRLMEIKATLDRVRERLNREREAANDDVVEREVCECDEELRSQWSTLQPPDHLVERVTRLAVEVRQRRADAVLDRLLPQLEAAHGELARDRAAAKASLTRLADAWNGALAERGVIDPDDPRLGRVAAIVGYVTLFQEHESLAAEVGHRVAERPATLRARIAWADELGRMMDRIDDSATRLPPDDVEPRRIKDLSERVADIAEDVQREEWQRRALVVTTAAVVLVAVSTLAWGAFALRRHRTGVAIAVAACDEAVQSLSAGEDAYEPDEADWPDSVRRDPTVTASLDRVRAAVEKQAERRRAFAEVVSELGTALADLHSAPRPDPLSPWPDAFARATRLLADVRERQLAIMDEDRAKLEAPAAALRIKAKDFTAAADDAFEDRVHRIEADLKAVEVLLIDDAQRAQTRIDEAGTELDRLRGLASPAACPSAVEGYGGRRLVSDSVAALVAPDSKAAIAINGLRSRRETLSGIAARERQADVLLMDGKYAEYGDAIRRIADDLGTGTIARDYGDVARDHAQWQAITAWGRFVESLDELAEIPAAQAKELLDQLKGFGSEVTRMETFNTTKAWLEPALERAVESTPEKHAALKAACLPILEGVYGEQLDGMVWEKGVSTYPRYYCRLKERPLPDQKKPFAYVTGLPDAQRTWPENKGTFRFDADIHVVADSPQKRLAMMCKKVIEQERASATAVDRLAVDVALAGSGPVKPAPGEPPLDPCLQTMLLRFLLIRACDASPFLKDKLVRSHADMNAGPGPDGQVLMLKGVDNGVFGAVLDPEKQDSDAWVRANRAKCEAFVGRVAREAGEAERALEAREQDIARRLHGLVRYRCVGRLRKRAEGGWSITGGDPAIRAGQTVFVTGGVLRKYEMISRVECDGQGEIPAGRNVNARAGDPVFVAITSHGKD